MYHVLVKELNTIYTSGLVKKPDLNANINEIKDKIPSITG